MLRIKISTALTVVWLVSPALKAEIHWVIPDRYYDAFSAAYPFSGTKITSNQF